MSTTSLRFAPMTPFNYAVSIGAMIIIVVASNVLVQFPLNNWLTWGAISYPIAFLVADLINRRFGAKSARQVAVAGFVVAIVFSVWVATPRIALASGIAFLFAQLLDIYVFDRLRQQQCWRAPLIGGIAGATLDTFLFFSIAFAGTGINWMALLVGDLAVKLAVNTALLAPFRALMWNIARPAKSA